MYFIFCGMDAQVFLEIYSYTVNVCTTNTNKIKVT